MAFATQYGAICSLLPRFRLLSTVRHWQFGAVWFFPVLTWFSHYQTAASLPGCWSYPVSPDGERLCFVWVRGVELETGTAKGILWTQNPERSPFTLKAWLNNIDGNKKQIIKNNYQKKKKKEGYLDSALQSCSCCLLIKAQPDWICI